MPAEILIAPGKNGALQRIAQQLAGYEDVAIMDSGNALLWQARQDAPEIVLADVELDDMDGPTLIEIVPNLAPDANLILCGPSTPGLQRALENTNVRFIPAADTLDQTVWAIYQALGIVPPAPRPATGQLPTSSSTAPTAPSARPGATTPTQRRPPQAASSPRPDEAGPPPPASPPTPAPARPVQPAPVEATPSTPRPVAEAKPDERATAARPAASTPLEIASRPTAASTPPQPANAPPRRPPVNPLADRAAPRPVNEPRPPEETRAASRPPEETRAAAARPTGENRPPVPRPPEETRTAAARPPEENRPPAPRLQEENRPPAPRPSPEGNRAAPSRSLEEPRPAAEESRPAAPADSGRATANAPPPTPDAPQRRPPINPLAAGERPAPRFAPGQQSAGRPGTDQLSAARLPVEPIPEPQPPAERPTAPLASDDGVRDLFGPNASPLTVDEVRSERAGRPPINPLAGDIRPPSRTNAANPQAAVDPFAPRGGPLIIRPQQTATIRALLTTLATDVGAQAVLLSDTAGMVLLEVGELTNIMTRALGPLLATSFSTATEISRQLREQDSNALYLHEGARYDIYAFNVGYRFILTLIFDKDIGPSKLGSVWVYAKRATRQLQLTLERG